MKSRIASGVSVGEIAEAERNADTAMGWGRNYEEAHFRAIAQHLRDTQSEPAADLGQRRDNLE